MTKLSRMLRDKNEPEVVAGDGVTRAAFTELQRRVKLLEDELAEAQRVSRRLADVVDVVAELLVPAMDRDDARVAAALSRLEPKKSDNFD